MGHLIFFILHIVAVLFGFVFLFITIPAHLIYSAVSGKSAQAGQPANNRRSLLGFVALCVMVYLLFGNADKHHVETSKTTATEEFKNSPANRSTPDASIIAGDASSFQKPSWCTKATTPAEKMVCQDSGLSASAITLETRWGEYKATHTPAEIAPIKETLRGWNKNVLQVCSTVECATDAYQKLLKSLF